MSYRVIIVTADRDDSSRQAMMELFDNIVKDATEVQVATKYYFNNLPSVNTYKEIADGLMNIIQEVKNDILRRDEFILNVSVEPEYMSAMLMVCAPYDYNRDGVKEENVYSRQEVMPGGTIVRTIRNLFRKF